MRMIKLAQHMKYSEDKKMMRMIKILFCVFLISFLIIKTISHVFFIVLDGYSEKLELLSENYLKLTYYGRSEDELKTPIFEDTMVQSEPGKYVEEAVIFLTNGGYSSISVSLNQEPELSEGEKLAIYTIEGDRLLKPIDSDGKRAEVAVDEAQGLALVKEFSTADVEKQEINVDIGDGTMLSFNGYMPPNASINVNELECDSDDVVHRFDITITDILENEFQPLPGCPIDIRVESEKIRRSISNGMLLDAEHIRDDGTVESVGLTLSSEGASVLSASGFSEYKIKQHGLNPVLVPRRFYHFLHYDYTKCDAAGGTTNDDYYRAGNYNFKNKAGDETNVQIIKSGDELEHIPVPPNKDGQYFFGWYVIEKTGSIDNDTIYQWGTSAAERVVLGRKITFTDTEDMHIYLAPMYSNYRIVSFHEDEKEKANSSNILTRKLVALGDNNSVSVKISDVHAYPPDAKRIIFWGWLRDALGEEVQRTVDSDGNEIETSIDVRTEDGNIDIYPVFKSIVWINFNSGGNGAEYVPSKFLMEKDSSSSSDVTYSSTTQLKVTTRPGFVFDGWYADADHNIKVADKNGNVVKGANTNFASGSISATGELTLTNDLTLYAKWTAVETTSYTIVYWRQKVTDNKFATDDEKTYDFAALEDKPGVVPGYVITESRDVNKTKDSSSEEADKDYKGFEYSRYSVNNNGIVEADGSTVLNVYYDRRLMLIDFFFKSGDTLPTGDNYHVCSTDSYYTWTDSDEGTQYGLVDGKYEKLDFETHYTYLDNPYYYFKYKYTSSTSTSSSANLYGITPKGYYAEDKTEFVKLGSGLWKVNFSRSNNTYYWNDDYYGIVGNILVKLTRKSSTQLQYNSAIYSGPVYITDTSSSLDYTYLYKKDGDRFVISTDHNDDNLYGYIDDVGAFFALTKSNNSTGLYYGNYTYYVSSISTKIRRPRYTRSEVNAENAEHYEGTIYVKTIDGFREKGVDSISVDDKLYGKITVTETETNSQGRNTTSDRDVYVELGQYGVVQYKEWYLNGQPYTGDRYTKSDLGSGASWIVMKETDATSGTLYGYDGFEYRPITKETVLQRQVWLMNGREYTGPRYASSGTVSASTFTHRMTLSGLYGSTFEQNGYSWEDVSYSKWTDVAAGSGTTTTMLDAFLEKAGGNPFNLYSQGPLPTTGIYYINHYKQNLSDENWDQNNVVAAKTSNSSGTFTFTNKFQGFTVYKYTQTNFSATGGTGSVIDLDDDGESDKTSVSYPLHVYHKRNKYNLTFFDTSKTGEDQEVIDLQVPFEYKIKEVPLYKENGSNTTINDILGINLLNEGSSANLTKFFNIFNPKLAHYNFLGWFEDPKGQRKFNFEETMPAASKAIYGCWDPMRYLVQIDPNGAVFDHLSTNYDTYSWQTYGSSIEEFEGLSREYVPNDNGEYVYINITFNGEKEAEGISKNLRNAVYKKADEVDDYYNANYAGKMLREDFDACVSTQRYKEIGQNEEYVMLGWFQVKDDGTLSPTPYNFADQVSSDIKLRAKWSLTGKYHIIYQGDMRAGGVYVDGAPQVIYDPPWVGDPDDPNRPYYKDQAETIIESGTTSKVSEYSFAGWRIVDKDGTRVLNDKIYMPGDLFTIDAQYADSNGDIWLQAYYEKEDNDRVVGIAQLVLDANGGNLNGDDLTSVEKYLNVDTRRGKISFTNRPNNTDINLGDYSDKFTHPYGRTLLGWSRTPNPQNNRPDYYIDDIIGIDKNDVTNTLYAVWEKTEMYLTLKNNASESITTTVSFPGYTGSIYTVSGEDRIELNSQTITLAAGEERTLAIEDKDTNVNYQVSGTYKGSKNALCIQTGMDGDQRVLKNESYSVSGAMTPGLPGKIITFYEEIPVPPPTAAELSEKYNIAMMILSGFCLAMISTVFFRFKKKQVNNSAL